MTAITFDSLRYLEKLTAAGVPKSQAKAMSEAQREVLTEIVEDHLATKLDIAGLNNKIDVSTAGLNSKIDVAVAEFNGKFNLLYWMIGFLLAFDIAFLFKFFA